MQNEKNSDKKETTDEKVLSFYGMATRAGKTVSGMDQACAAAETGCIYIFLVADDASVRTRKKIIELSRLYKIPCFLFSNIEGLGKFSGKNGRAVCGVTDEGFAKKLQLLLTENQNALQIQ